MAADIRLRDERTLTLALVALVVLGVAALVALTRPTPAVESLWAVRIQLALPVLVGLVGYLRVRPGASLYELAGLLAWGGVASVGATFVFFFVVMAGPQPYPGPLRTVLGHVARYLLLSAALGGNFAVAATRTRPTAVVGVVGLAPVLCLVALYAAELLV